METENSHNLLVISLEIGKLIADIPESEGIGNRISDI